MALDSTQLNNLLAIRQPDVAEVLAVYWSPSVTKYYAWSDYSKLINFGKIPFSPIEPVILGGFRSFEINGDLSDENIAIEFSDLDQAIFDLYETNGEGVKCELFYYYPQINGFESVWWGQLLVPDESDFETFKANLSNGFKSRELLMPRRMRPFECTAIFGGHFQTLADFRHNGCKYNRHISGGTIGNLNGGVPYANCGQLESDCIARGMQSYYMGFKTDVSAILTDPRTSFMAQTRGNVSNLKEPIRVIAGRMKVRKLNLLLWRREPNSKTPDKGWVSCLWEIGETVQSISNVKVNNFVIPYEHLNVRTGEIAQPPTSYAPDVPNYSGTAIAFTRYGWVNAANVSPSNLEGECDVTGFPYVRKYTNQTTFTEIYTNNRTWWVQELYTNNRFGRGYNNSKFNQASFIEVANFQENIVRFTSPTNVTYDHQRTQFDAVIEGKPTHEQIKNICRAGRMSVPFQYQGQYHVVALKKEDLGSVRTFTDEGTSRNILADQKGKSSLRASKISNAVLTNHIVLSFLDAANEYVERPLVFSDPNQKALAGMAFGDTNFHENQKAYVATGVTNLNEAIKLGYSLLWFGEFDEGGIKNNCRVTFNTTYEQVIGLKKYQVIKVQNTKLQAKFGFEYFRFLKARKLADNSVAVTAQAYNPTAYDTFETDVPIISDPGYTPPDIPVPGPPDYTIYNPFADFGNVIFRDKFLEIEILEA